MRRWSRCWDWLYRTSLPARIAWFCDLVVLRVPGDSCWSSIMRMRFGCAGSSRRLWVEVWHIDWGNARFKYGSHDGLTYDCVVLSLVRGLCLWVDVSMFIDARGRNNCGGEQKYRAALEPACLP